MNDFRFALLLSFGMVCGCAGVAGCSSKGPIVLKNIEPIGERSSTQKDRKHFIEDISGTALVELYADGFDQLSLNDKLLAWHLYKACLAGRDITYDQTHRHALAIRGLLDRVVTHPLGLPPETEAAILRYAKLFWLNNGPYFAGSKMKIPVEFTRGQFLEALGVAAGNGADFSDLGGPVEDVVLEVEKTIFDPLYEPVLTNKNPGPNGDILRDSANNYYVGVTMADLEGFNELYPLNSRLVKECGKKKRCALVEQVYRAGLKDEKGAKWLVPEGLYGTQLRDVVGHLEDALGYAAAGQAKYIRHLINYFRSGDPSEFDKASVAWLQEDPNVDVVIGFIETYKDPRGRKGEFEGLVYYKDPEFTTIMKRIADNARRFEERAPWDEKYKNKEIKVPVASAVKVLIGVGGAGPNIPAGINLPNAQWIREKHGSRSLLLRNVIDGAEAAILDKVLQEFALPEEIPAARRYHESATRAMVALHEIIGHGSGRVSPALSEDPSVYLKETYSTLEETRADLVALYHIWDPLLVEIGAIPDPQAVLVAYRDYVRGDLTQLRRLKTGDTLQGDHMRARHLIVQYVMRNSHALEIRKIEGKTFFVLRDPEEFRDTVGALLSEVMRIKAEGDLESARELIGEYGVRFDPALRDEVVARARAAGVPDFVAFHVPALKLVYDEKGSISDVVVDYSKDFLTTMLEWDLLGAQ